MAIKIVTDSAADYNLKEIERRRIACVPMSVVFGEKEYLDGVNLSKEEFYQLLEEEEAFPKTAQPSPAEFEKLFQEAKEAGDTVIAILISGALSGTVQSATLAKSMVEYENIYIVDSLTATLGMRILVDQAVRMRDRGCDAQSIVEELEQLKSRIRIYAGLGTLENLYRGGRLSKSAAGIATLANIKPVITITREGMVEVVGKQVGLRNVCKHIAGFLEREQPDEDYYMYFLYSQDTRNCMTLIHQLQKKGFALDDVKSREIGPTIGTHIGPGAYGVVYVCKRAIDAES